VGYTRALYVRFPMEMWAKLEQLGVLEYRTPKEQASVLLIEAIERRFESSKAGGNALSHRRRRDQHPEPV
jgi:hypothetical protein